MQKGKEKMNSNGIDEKEVMDDLFGDEDEQDDTEGVSQLKQSTCSEMNPRDPACGVLAFHDGTEEALFVHLRTNAKPGDISQLLMQTDQFCYTRHWMMHIGDQKRQVIESVFVKALQEKRQRDSSSSFVAVELGSYCGYSALVFAQHLQSNKQEHLFCVEAHPKCVTYTRRMVEMAQVDDRVTVIAAPASDVSQWQQLLPHSIDFLFIDHDKNSYLSDLQAIEQAQLLSAGAIVVADNVLCLERPLTAYLNYVRDSSSTNTPFQSSTLHEGFLEYTTEVERTGSQAADMIDGIEVSIHR
jgi:catechol O-methyltransferase